MPSIKTLMSGLGFHNQSADFYIPRNHPHAHVRVYNAERIVNNVADIRQYIVFIALSFGDGVNTVNVYRRNPEAKWPEELEHGHFNPHKKERLEEALLSLDQTHTARTIQRALNLLTGMGIDYG